MRIAICDDDSLDLLYISKLLEKYHQKTSADFTCKMFLNATELLYSMETSFYDLLFLDIFMGGFNGIEAAREIRLFNPSVKIIFLTSSPEFALQSYGVKAFD